MTEATAKIPVTLTDGSTVEFNPKQKMVKTPIVTEDGTAGVRLDFRNGETRTFIVPASLVLRAAAHGISQKLGDTVTSEDNLDDAILSLDEVIAQLAGGNWSAERKKGSNAGASILLKAIVESFGKTVEEVRAFLATKTAAEKMALRRSSKLAAAITRLEAERDANRKSSVDTDALLGELDGGEADEAPAKKAKG